MIHFEANYFDGKTSKRHYVTAIFDGQSLTIRLTETGEDLLFPMQDCTISPALGSTKRSILLPNGAKCETNDHGAISSLEKETGGNVGLRLVHQLEQRWRLALSCMAGLIVSVFLFTAYGIPVIASLVANQIPVAMMNTVSDDVLILLDKQLFQPTQLPQEKQEELTRLLNTLKKDIGSAHDYQLNFRRSVKVGANAFALPSGSLIVTDELIAMIEDPKEITGILLHEMGHVEHRHGLRSVLQNTGVFFLISALAGDMVSISSVAGSFPTLLVESGYSRKFETEADQFTAEYFISKGWSTEPFQAILSRITKDIGPGISMISTHPGTEQRIKFLQSLDKSRY